MEHGVPNRRVMNATAQSTLSMKPAIVSIISNPDGFIEASPIMISISPAILNGFADIIPLASGMKSVSETVFSILQMIIDATARTLSVADRLLSVSGIIVCAAARILSVAEIIISNRRQIPSNPRYGGFALIDNYFRHGNDWICLGKDYLKDANNAFQRRPNFLQLAHNLLRNERI